MTRTDIHRPSAPEFDPETYVVFGFADFHPTDGVRPVATVARLVDEGWSFKGAPHGSGECSHCGARLRYAALMGHEPTKTLLYVGETCLDNRFSLTKGEFEALRKAGRMNAERRTRDEKVAALIEKAPVLVWASYARNIESAGGVQEWTTAHSYGEDTFTNEADAQEWIDRQVAKGLRAYANDYPIFSYERGSTLGEKARFTDATGILSDLWHKAEKYGDLSDKQLAFAARLVEQVTEKFERYEARQAETQAKVDAGVKVPTGRIVIEGEVASTKWVENDFGSTQKMLVVSDEGWKVWGTVPSSIDVEKGSRVRFTGTVEQSRDDVLFGFFKRPAKAVVI